MSSFAYQGMFPKAPDPSAPGAGHQTPWRKLDALSSGVRVSTFKGREMLEIDGAGELHWDQRAGHFVAFEFSGEITQVIDVSMSLTMGTQALEIEQAMTMAGSVELNFQSTPE